MSPWPLFPPTWKRCCTRIQTNIACLRVGYINHVRTETVCAMHSACVNHGYATECSRANDAQVASRCWWWLRRVHELVTHWGLCCNVHAQLGCQKHSSGVDGVCAGFSWLNHMRKSATVKDVYAYTEWTCISVVHKLNMYFRSAHAKPVFPEWTC